MSIHFFLKSAGVLHKMENGVSIISCAATASTRPLRVFKFQSRAAIPSSSLACEDFLSVQRTVHISMMVTTTRGTATPTINPVLFFFEGRIGGIPATVGVKSEGKGTS